MISVPRNDTSVVGRWWWTVDRWSLGAVLLIMAVGVMLTMAASPPAAERIGADSFHFVRRQLLFLPIALGIMLAISLAPPRMVRRLALVVFAIGLIALAATMVVGTEIKGARRWISLPGFGTLQPSEFVKPSLAVISAWLFAQKKLNPRFPGFLLATLLFAAVLGMLLVQPDLGMSVVVTVVWAAQFFLAGLPLWLAVVGTGMAGVGLVGAYLSFSHVQSRIERFMNPDAGENYQVNTALEAFMNGGMFGRGPGEGTVKAQLPDAHTDFVMAVAGEEFGLIACLIVLLLFAFVTLRSMSRIMNETSLFIMLAAAGLVIQFGLQAFINMASTVQLMPAKGMTLPFISYGGSSAVAMAVAVGMMLALTRERAGLGEAA
ncbi:FtsW/RodA/SpoVE family cell cycle protein [Reyranella sp. CPCC 100927]|uniref:FtsW/RodA/SpoVE family cell cycle protein n=1 Tax=Reyranella sp. CPCC 100927 TaxID=2599616 RepID=UPI0011B5082D|nr:putative peptidoglycan glycosyltransferase FtsW [Reyranella sp. CPCC 100927]TWT06082.1 cell division protein FtsW [Reyranella sp. CPCC 100927]